MTRPAKRNSQADIYRNQKRQSIVLLGIIIVAAAYSMLIGDVSLAIAKSVAAGGVLAYLAQCVFTFIAYRETGARQSRQIMLNMYLGQMLKWAVTLIGFALIFTKAIDVNVLMVILGYLLMQLVHTLSLMRLK